VTRISEVESILLGDIHYVRIHDDTGLTGLGQSACWGYPEAVHSVMATFRRYLLGKDPSRIEHHWQYLYRMGPFRGSVLSAAVSAVDIALWELKAKRLGVPVWELLGGRYRDRIRLHVLLEGTGAEELVEQAREAVAEGFTAVKFDPFPKGYADLALDRLTSAVVDTVAAVRAEIGPDVDLILEMHRKLTPLQAVPIGEAIAQFRPLAYEDAIQIDSIVSQAELAKRLSVATAHGERFNTIWEFRELLAHGGPQYLRPDIGQAGGFSHVRKIAALGEAYHSAVVTHNYLGPVLTAASVHLDVSIPNFITQEYSRVDDSEAFKAVRSSLRREGGYIEAPDKPGLGVELDDDNLSEIRILLRDVTSIPLREDGSVAFSV
jgi:galactonate dehydratase